MHTRNIPYGKIVLYVAIIIAMSAIGGYACAKGHYAYMILCVPIVILCLLRLFKFYGEVMHRLMFIFNAVQNNDYSFRFTENPKHTKYAFVNQSLNRIKDILDNAKLQIKERERYFELIMECANIGIVTVMENGIVAQTNSKALHILGMERLSHIDQLQTMCQELCETMRNITPDERRIVCLNTEVGEQNLVLNCSAMEFDGKMLRIISIGNIHEELDCKEVESWEKITRILTHEIMNSLAPLTSISHILLAADTDDETMRRGLETIHTTSDKLLRFVNSFRAVTRIPAPQKTPFYLSELLEEAISLTTHDGIEIEMHIEPEDTMLYADRTLMSQVMVNLLKNANEALSFHREGRKISITSTIDLQERIIIEIANNGPAIPTEVADSIFTPFFTTKTDGSGVGLAISRQIISRHGGSIRLKRNDEGLVIFAIVME